VLCRTPSACSPSEVYTTQCIPKHPGNRHTLREDAVYKAAHTSHEVRRALSQPLPSRYLTVVTGLLSLRLCRNVSLLQHRHACALRSLLFLHKALLCLMRKPSGREPLNVDYQLRISLNLWKGGLADRSGIPFENGIICRRQKFRLSRIRHNEKKFFVVLRRREKYPIPRGRVRSTHKRRPPSAVGRGLKSCHGYT
jgi:hypothetical protein